MANIDSKLEIDVGWRLTWCLGPKELLQPMLIRLSSVVTLDCHKVQDGNLCHPYKMLPFTMMDPISIPFGYTQRGFCCYIKFEGDLLLLILMGSIYHVTTMLVG